ncbi:thioredoxin, mitochondrial-like [Limulus polyphemus]|uniref:Thioredoxin, mitochondrial-like n=1 Tax=Limulus polyphemus TaxID=6850 RepID=A0ABM1BKT5_LIMPO|nr:thioredoxin, mitochondrial-like [Limulus polyphemus]
MNLPAFLCFSRSVKTVRCFFRSTSNVGLRLTTGQKHRSIASSSCLWDSFNVQDNADFEDRVLKSNVPVIVDFHATWCGPCKLLGPRLEKVIDSKGDKVHLAKVDIDNLTELAMEYGVSAVPSVVGIKDGKVLDQFVGVLDEDKLESFVDKLIGPSDF